MICQNQFEFTSMFFPQTKPHISEKAHWFPISVVSPGAPDGGLEPGLNCASC